MTRPTSLGSRMRVNELHYCIIYPPIDWQVFSKSPSEKSILSSRCSLLLLRFWFSLQKKIQRVVLWETYWFSPRLPGWNLLLVGHRSCWVYSKECWDLCCYCWSLGKDHQCGKMLLLVCGVEDHNSQLLSNYDIEASKPGSRGSNFYKKLVSFMEKPT